MEPLVELNEPKFSRILGFEKICKNISNKIWISSSVNIKEEVLENEDQFLHCKIFEISSGHSFLATFVYAKCSRRDMYALWDGISNFVASTNMPWCVGGEFNIITTLSEKEWEDPFQTLMPCLILVTL